MEDACHRCGKKSNEVRLRKCRICHKHYCDEHSVQRSGMSFCTQSCADYFFFADPDD